MSNQKSGSNVDREAAVVEALRLCVREVEADCVRAQAREALTLYDESGRAGRLATARQRLAELLDADTYDCATLHTAARDLLNALEG